MRSKISKTKNIMLAIIIASFGFSSLVLAATTSVPAAANQDDAHKKQANHELVGGLRQAMWDDVKLPGGCRNATNNTSAQNKCIITWQNDRADALHGYYLCLVPGNDKEKQPWLHEKVEDIKTCNDKWVPQFRAITAKINACCYVPPAPPAPPAPPHGH